MNILISIGLWLLKFASSAAVKAILQKVLDDLVQLGKDDLQVVVQTVKDASLRTDLTGGEKYELVVKTLQEKFPEMTAALMNRLIENAYGALDVLIPDK